MKLSFTHWILPAASTVAVLFPSAAFAYSYCFSIPTSPVFKLSTVCTDAANGQRVAVEFSKLCSYNPNGRVTKPEGYFKTTLIRGGEEVVFSFETDIPELVGSSANNGTQQWSAAGIALAKKFPSDATPLIYGNAFTPRAAPNITWKKDFATAETPWSLSEVHLDLTQRHPQGFDFRRFPENTTVDLVDCSAR